MDTEPAQPAQTPPAQSERRVVVALTLLAGTLLVLMVLLSGIGWLGWRLYRSGHGTANAPVHLASHAPSPISNTSALASNLQSGHPDPTTNASTDRPLALAVAATAPATQRTGATNTILELTGFSPTRAATGEIITLTGHGLSNTAEVILIPMDAASFYEAAAIEHTDAQVTFAVPQMSGTTSLHFALGVFDDDGGSLLIDQSVPASALGGVVPTRNGALLVSPGDSLNVEDHLLVVAEEGSRVAVGHDCFVVLEKEARLCVFGKNCHVFANFDRQVLSPGEIRGNTNLPSVRVTFVQHDLEYRGDP